MSASLVLEIAEACAIQQRPYTLTDLQEYCESKERATREAAKAAIWLGLVRSDGQTYTTVPEVRSDFPLSAQKGPLLLARVLQEKKPFLQFIAFLDLGRSVNEAATKVRVTYALDVKAEVLASLLSSWGKFAGILVDGPDGIALKPELHAPDLPTEYVEGLMEALASDLRAKIWIAKKLTDEVLRDIPGEGVNRAVHALRGTGADPRNSVEDIGEFFEDYLRLVAARHQLVVSDARGIGSLLGALEREKLVCLEHEVIGRSVNDLRIMSAHPERATTGRRWEIRKDSALDAVLLTMSLIRSMEAFDLQGATSF